MKLHQNARLTPYGRERSSFKSNRFYYSSWPGLTRPCTWIPGSSPEMTVWGDRISTDTALSRSLSIFPGCGCAAQPHTKIEQTVTQFQRDQSPDMPCPIRHS